MEAYLPLLESALRQSVAQSATSGNVAFSRNGVHPLVSDIIISHRHHDHHSGLPGVLALLHTLGTAAFSVDGNGIDLADASGLVAAATAEKPSHTPKYYPPRIHKLPSPWEKKALLFAAESEGASFDSTLKAISQLPHTHFEHSDVAPAPPTDDTSTTESTTGASVAPIVHDLMDGQTITTESTSSPLELKILHTPGHTTDSISLLLPAEGSMFSADTVLGEGTAVFEDLGVYMRSLRLMLDKGPGLIDRTNQKDTEAAAGAKLRIYPGHGPVIDDGLKTLETYIAHRSEREAQILALLPTSVNAKELSAGSAPSIRSIVSNLYAKYPQAVWPAAERGVWLHLQKLESEGRVRTLGSPTSTSLLDMGTNTDVPAAFGRLREAEWVRLDDEGQK